jgi:hypothetical protein
VIAFQIGSDGALLHRRVFANFERMSRSATATLISADHSMGAAA